MSYVKTSWNDDAPPAVSGTNLNKLEQGVYDAHLTADGAIQKPAAPNDLDVLTYDVASGTWVARPASTSGDLYTASTTSSVPVSSATDLVTLGAQTYQAIPYWFDFNCPYVEMNANNFTSAIATLYVDGAALAEIGRVTNPSNTNLLRAPMRVSIKVTPTAGSHTIKVVGTQLSGNPTFKAGVGTGGALAPMTLRCRKA